MGATSGPSSGPRPSGSYVTDEGPGFDPAAVPEPIRPEQLDEANGRGLYLIRKLVDAVQLQRARELHLHDTAPSVGRLDLVVDGLGALVQGRVRLWRYDGRALRLAAGADPGVAPAVPRAAGLTPTPGGTVWLEP